MLNDIKKTYYRIDKWVKPDSTPFSPLWAAVNPKIRKEPKGVVLIMAPFNFPVLLLLGPLVSLSLTGMH